MSALVRITDSGQTLRHVRNVLPITEASDPIRSPRRRTRIRERTLRPPPRRAPVRRAHLAGRRPVGPRHGQCGRLPELRRRSFWAELSNPEALRPSSTIGICHTANFAAITRPARPEAPRIQIACPCSANAAVLAHANTSSLSLASPCVMDEPCFAFSEATGHAPSATKAHVTGLGIVLCNALPEFAPH